MPFTWAIALKSSDLANVVDLTIRKSSYRNNETVTEELREALDLFFEVPISTEKRQLTLVGFKQSEKEKFESWEVKCKSLFDIA